MIEISKTDLEFILRVFRGWYQYEPEDPDIFEVEEMEKKLKDIFYK